MDISEKPVSASLKESLQGQPNLDPGFLSPRTVTKKCLVFKPPGQWYFVIAARADQYNREINATYENC